MIRTTQARAIRLIGAAFLAGVYGISVAGRAAPGAEERLQTASGSPAAALGGAVNDHCANAGIICTALVSDPDLGFCAGNPPGQDIAEVCSLSNQDCAFGLFGAVCVPRMPATDAYRCTTLISNAGATTDGPDLSGSLCTLSPIGAFGADVWYDLTAPCTGRMTISMCGESGFDTMLAVYSDGTNSCSCPLNNVSNVACNDDHCDFAAASGVEVNVASDQCYKVRVGGFDGVMGTGALDVGFLCDPPPGFNPPLVPPPPHDITKNRYVSFTPNNSVPVAFRITNTSNLYFPGAVGEVYWVGAPDANGMSLLVPNPVIRVWSEPVIHVRGCEITPASAYDVQASDGSTTVGGPLSVSTTPRPTPKFWGDIVGSSSGGMWDPPNGIVNLNDFTAVLQCFQALATAPHVTRADVVGVSDFDSTPDGICDMSDVFFVQQAFVGSAYPFSSHCVLGPVGSCCNGIGLCILTDEETCLLAGASFGGIGTQCENLEACCMPDATCQMLAAACCLAEGGSPGGAGSTCGGLEACCYPDGSCENLDTACCDNNGGTSGGAGSACAGDANSNLIDDACENEAFDPVVPTAPCIVDSDCLDSGGPALCVNGLCAGCTVDADCVNFASCVEGVCYAPQSGFASFVPPVACGVADITETFTPTLPIPDCNGTTYNPLIDTRMVAASGIISDLDVSLHIDHPYVGDLVVTLTHVGSGTVVTLMSRVGFTESSPFCGSGSCCGSDSDGVDVTFDDAAFKIVETGPFPLVGHYRGETGLTGNPSLLAEFAGLELSGQWQLTVSDNEPVDTGTLVSWSLHARVETSCPAPRSGGASVLAAGFDCDGNGIDDDCDISCGMPLGPCDVPGCGTRSGGEVAIRMELDASNIYPGDVGMQWWLTAPELKSDGKQPPLYVSRLSATPVYRVWSEPVVYVGDCPVHPAAVYEVSGVRFGTDCGSPGSYSRKLLVPTAPDPLGAPEWGDVVGDRIPGARWAPPNGTCNILDAVAVLQAFQGLPSAPLWVWADVHHGGRNHFTNIADVYDVLRAFQGIPYPYCAPSDCNLGWFVPNPPAAPCP